jgi:hypothetical protein
MLEGIEIEKVTANELVKGYCTSKNALRES